VVSRPLPPSAAPPLVAALLVLGAAGTSCALSFPDYDVAVEGSSSSSSSSSGVGGGGGGAPLLAPNGSVCEGDGECESGNCLANNTEPGRVCCAVACDIMGADTCGTNGKCDASGADCALHPAGIACGAPTCDGGEVTTRHCYGGACEAGEPEPCAGGLLCAGDGESCAMTCTDAADCANPSGETVGADCVSGVCADRPVGAACESDDECESGSCAGRCCAGPCDTSDATCGATACDSEGACVYPSTDTPCGAETNCTGGELESQYCDGDGACGRERVLLCRGHLGCATDSTCHESCGSNDATGDALCPAGYWCDGSTCHQGGFDETTACYRGGQCLSKVCGANGTCTDVGCDFDGDLHERGACGGLDCDDNDARVHPEQTEFFATPRSIGGFDFDCSGAAEHKTPTSCACSGHALLVPTGEVGCGVNGQLRSCWWAGLCGHTDTSFSATQLCR